MKLLVTLCLVAAVAQATYIDWTKVEETQPISKGVTRLLDQNRGAVETPASSRIIGGEEATGDLRFVVWLEITKILGISERYGGAIMSENWILTCAACVQNAEKIIVVAGSRDRTASEKTVQKVLVSTKPVFHPGWRPPNFGPDLAILRLNVPLKFNGYVGPISLPTYTQAATETFVGKNATEYGWGRYTTGSISMSPVLRSSTSPVLSTRDCRLSLTWVGEGEICISGKTSRSACAGDGGGPLVTRERYDSTLIGIISEPTLVRCDPAWPTVGTRVSAHLDWIRDISGIPIED